MTSRPIKKTPATRSADRFPEFPPRDDMQNSIYLDAPAHQAALSHHFGIPDTTIILSEVPLGRTVRQRQGLRVPDLLVAFGVDHAGVIDRRGYSIEEHEQTAGLRAGCGVRDHGAERLHSEAGRLRCLRRAGVLAVRPIGRRIPRRPPGRRPPGRRRLPSHRSCAVRRDPATGAAARSWAWTYAGRTASSAGTTRRAAATC